MKRFLLSGSVLLASLAVVVAGGSTPRREDVPKYLEMLRSPKGEERARAAEMLGKRGQINIKDVADAIVPLRTMLKSDQEILAKRAAARSLGWIAPEPASATVPLLIEALEASDMPLRMNAVQALAAYGHEAKDALPALRKMQKELGKKGGKAVANAINIISEKKRKKG